MKKEKTTEERVKELINNGGILIGSRAFEVEDEYSDYDIAILESNLPNDLIETIAIYGTISMKNYFNYLPPLGNYKYIPKYFNIDILIFDDESIIKDLQDTVNELKQIPSYYLKNKSTRIELFETGLKHRKWKKQDSLL